MSENDEIVIIVRGGVVQEVRSSKSNIEVSIVDFDDLEAEGNLEVNPKNEGSHLIQIY